MFTPRPGFWIPGEAEWNLGPQLEMEGHLETLS